MKPISIFLITLLFISCRSSPQAFSSIKFEGNIDSCYRLQDSINRQVEIIENTLQDTILLGFAIIPPKYVGSFSYLSIDSRNDILINPETPEELMPKTKMVCINLYKEKKVKGYITLKVKK